MFQRVENASLFPCGSYWWDGIFSVIQNSCLITFFYLCPSNAPYVIGALIILDPNLSSQASEWYFHLLCHWSCWSPRQRQEKSQPKALWESFQGSPYTTLLEARVPAHQRWATNEPVLFPTIFSAVTCLNVFSIFHLISQTSGKYQWGFRALWHAAWETNIQSICWFFHYFAHFRAQHMESTIFWQTMLEMFIDNPSPHFFSLHPLGFYMSMGSLHNLAEKVTALSCRV